MLQDIIHTATYSTACCSIRSSQVQITQPHTSTPTTHIYTPPATIIIIISRLLINAHPHIDQWLKRQPTRQMPIVRHSPLHLPLSACPPEYRSALVRSVTQLTQLTLPLGLSPPLHKKKPLQARLKEPRSSRKSVSPFSSHSPTQLNSPTPCSPTRSFPNSIAPTPPPISLLATPSFRPP